MERSISLPAGPAAYATDSSDAPEEDHRLPFARSESCCEHGVADVISVPLSSRRTQKPRRESVQRASVDFGCRRSSVRVLDPPTGRRSSVQPPMNWPPAAAAGAAAATEAPFPPPPMPPGKVTWASLPHKSQLAVLTLARLSEPLTQTSLQAYLYHQLASFSPDLPPSAIAMQAGLVQASFAAAQAVTAVFWGSIADRPEFGRKTVITIGLLGTGIGSLGYGFSRTLGAAIFWRLFAGSLNGNVGVMRTIVSEIVREKKYQSRAFLLLPMCFNIGVIIGPILGGLLAEPAQSYPGLFGPGSALGGEEGVYWMMRFPFALPNILSAFFLFSAALSVVFNLQETHPALQDREDPGLRFAHWITSCFRRLVDRRSSHRYKQLPSSPSHDPEDSRSLFSPATPLTPVPAPRKKPTPARRLAFRRIWTPNVITTLLSHFLLCMGIGTFGSLWYIFLSSPRSADPFIPPTTFSGGLGLRPSQVGFAMAVLGTIGITLQLLVYPQVSARLGTVLSYRAALALFPIVYVLTPYLSVLPSTTPVPQPAAGPGVWISLAALLGLYVLGRTFANPANVILVNNCSPHPSVLGFIHGTAQSISGIARTVGPLGGGWLFGHGEATGHVGLAHWVISLVSVAGILVSWRVREGDGHEVVLDGETRDGEEPYIDGVEEEDEEVSPTAHRGRESGRESIGDASTLMGDRDDDLPEEGHAK